MGASSLKVDELFAEVGMKLRAVRETKDISLADVAARTRINLNFLKQIEAGVMEGLPAFAFVRGFVRNFMQVLELEDPDLLAELQEIADLLSGKTQDEELLALKEQQKDSKPFPVVKIAAAGAALLIVIWIGYLLTGASSDSEEPPPPTTEEAQPPAGQENATSGSEGYGGGTLSSNETERTGAAPVASRDMRQLLKLTIRGLEPTWVRLSVDRAAAIEVLVKPAETLEWEANEEFRLTIGKSDGVAVYLNGEDILLPKSANRLISGIILNKLTLLKLEN